MREGGEGDLQGWRGERYGEARYVPAGLKRCIGEENRYLRCGSGAWKRYRPIRRDLERLDSCSCFFRKKLDNAVTPDIRGYCGSGEEGWMLV